MGGSDCELLHAGWLAQPVNAWSSGAYLAAAIWLLVSWWRRRLLPASVPPALLPGAIALAAVAFGSFAFHGPQPAWARVVHDASIAVLLVVVAAALELRRRGRLAVPAAAVATLALAGAFYLAGRTGSPLCSPSSFVQPHAVWHVLTATAAALCFRSRAVSRSEGVAG